MRILTVAILFACAAACGTPSNPSATNFSIERAKEVWAAQNLTNYRFNFQRSCFCAPDAVEPVTIDVRNGSVVGVISRRTGQPISLNSGIEWYSIDDLFRLLSDAEAAGTQPLIVEYSTAGYPSRLVIGAMEADAGIEYLASDVIPTH